MSVTTIDVVPTGGALGARVEGVDLRRIEEGPALDAIREAFLRHQMLCFPGQKLSADDQVRFCGFFGRADSSFRRPGHEQPDDYSRGVMLVSNVRKDGRPIGSLPDGEMQFHSDGAHRESPYRATTLYAIRVPSHGGDTLFANLYAAYESLPDEVKARIADLEVRNLYHLDATSRDQFGDDDALARRAAHPIVRIHPETGRAALFVNRLMSRHIEGLPQGEGDGLLEELIAATERPEIIHAHRWSVGDFLMWDNRCVNHARTDFPVDEVRLLRRYTVSDADA